MADLLPRCPYSELSSFRRTESSLSVHFLTAELDIYGIGRQDKSCKAWFSFEGQTAWQWLDVCTM